MPETYPPASPGIDQLNTSDVAPASAPSDAAGPAQPADAVHPRSDAHEYPHDENAGVGSEGEVDIWQGHYSLRNFAGRFLVVLAATAVWFYLLDRAWDSQVHRFGYRVPLVLVGVVVAFLWLGLLIRVIRARLGHHYRLTNRRLFVATGIFRRETDQLELLRVQDIFTSQDSLFARLLNVGTVRVVSEEPKMPNYQLMGVPDPKAIHDMVWHYARAEQDRRNVRVEQI